MARLELHKGDVLDLSKKPNPEITVGLSDGTVIRTTDAESLINRFTESLAMMAGESESDEK